MRPRARRLLGLAALLAVAALCLPLAGLARVGGGESYGGGGSGGGDWGGGGGDGGGGGALVGALISLALHHPQVGVPLLVLVAIGYFLVQRNKRAHALPDSTARVLEQARSAGAQLRRRRVKTELATLLGDDPNFSELLFLDFVQLLYARFQLARGSRVIEALRPYVAEELLERLAGVGAQLGEGDFAVTHPIVGSVSIERVTALEDDWQISCTLEANYTERVRRAEGRIDEGAWFSRNELLFRRRRGVLSQGPVKVRSLGCPACGGSIKLDREGVCAYCGQAVHSGLFAWELVRLDELVRTPRIETPLGGGGQEVGTDFPTVFDPELDTQVRSFRARYPGESLDRLLQRAREVFLELQRAWSGGNWEQARAYESDRLFQMHTFWMDLYRERGLTNRLEQVEILGVELCKLERDAFFEIAGLRIRARMIDALVDKQGEVVSGSLSAPRTFSEYWTFVRQAGFEPAERPAAGSCPSCGAPVKVAMDGRCEFCDANLASAEFDWTLSAIEQDEAYAG